VTDERGPNFRVRPGSAQVQPFGVASRIANNWHLGTMISMNFDDWNCHLSMATCARLLTGDQRIGAISKLRAG
jgi:hypothetical protein